jgi:hypothetical protein
MYRLYRDHEEGRRKGGGLRREMLAEKVGDSCKVTKNWNDIITLFVVGRGQSWQPEGSEGGVATLLCSVHAPGISQFADLAIPENGGWGPDRQGGVRESECAMKLPESSGSIDENVDERALRSCHRDSRRGIMCV